MKSHGLVAAALMLLIPSAPAEEKRISARSLLNQPAPDLMVEKWLTPMPDTQGKFVLIDFWATWCPPCRKAIPELNGFHRRFGDKLVVIGVSSETEEAVRKMTAPRLEYASAIDTQSRTSKHLEVKGIPHIIIIDPQGIVRWEGFPFQRGYELTESVIEDLMRKHGGR
jgi:cytochrome c biogenesis protein CcmG, thiol:disulfide interchange protein DsbE